MNNNFLEKIRASSVWNKEFIDWDDVLERGILKCDVIPEFTKAMISTIRTGDIAKNHAEIFFQKNDLSFAQKTVLEALYFSQQKYLTQNALSKFVYTSKANVSSILERMEQKGYIKREENQQNKREKKVYLTKLGQEKLLFIISSMKMFHQSNILTDNECKTLIKLLQKLRDGIKKLEKNE